MWYVGGWVQGMGKGKGGGGGGASTCAPASTWWSSTSSGVASLSTSFFLSASGPNHVSPVATSSMSCAVATVRMGGVEKREQRWG